MPVTTIPPSPINHFLDLLGTNWAHNLQLKTQWGVIIQPDSGTGLFSTIRNYTDIDVNGFYISPSIQSSILNEKTQPNRDGLGLYYAQSVKMPKEALNVASAGIDGMGGYLKGTIANDRLDTTGRHFSIDFLETNIDFVEGLARPWIIAAAYKGLIATSNNSIKATITVSEYARQSTLSQKPTRIIHQFTGCVPVDIQEKTLKYDSEEPSTNTVNWTFNHYTYKIGESL